MKKQLKLIMSAIFMVLASLTTYGQNVGEQFTVGDIRYEITSTASAAEVKIVVYEGTATEVDIPESVDHGTNTYTVTAIGENTDDTNSGIPIRPFWGKGLTRVSIPNTVTIIGLGAFDRNNLTEVDIPNSVTHIRKWGIAGNPLNEVTIPANVEYIGPQAFFGGQNIPIVRSERNPPPEIDETAFDTPPFHPTRKIDLVVPLTAIQAYEDAGWKDLFVSITAGVYNQDGIKYGIVDNQNEATVIFGENFNPRILAEVNIDGYSHPVPVTAIGDNAFGGRAIQTIVIPASVRSIGARAFYSEHIYRVMVNAAEPPELHDDAFDPLRRPFIDVFVPAGKAQDYIDAGWTDFKSVSTLVGQTHFNFGYLWGVTSVTPNKVRLIDFRGHPNTSRGGHVEIPSEIEYLPNSLDDNVYSVTSIGEGALQNLLSRNGIVEALTSVVIPSSVESIGNYAFAQNQLTEVDIPDGVTSIGESAFENNNLANVTIPNGVQRIGKDAFWQNQLTSVEIPESVTSLGQRAFGHNDLTEVTIPANVTTIGFQAFLGNDLKEVTISGNVRTIDLYAFQNNPNLGLVTVEANDPPTLHEHAFSNASRDQIDLVVPMSGTSIQVYLDNGWEGFKSISFGIFTVDDIRYGITSQTEVMVVDYTGRSTEVTIPETVDHDQNTFTVTAIGEGAFQNKQLANVELPVSVTSIRKQAFMDNQLTVVAIPGSVGSIGFHAFYNNPDLGLVTVRANNPPALDATAFANANRHQIVLVVPTGRIQAYEDNGWDGFKSISNGSPPPLPTIDAAPQSIDNLEPFTVNITFDDEVTGFELRDIQVTNATVTNFTGSGSTYSATIVPTLCDDITIDVPANVAIGTHSHLPNLAATQIIVTVDRKMACSADVPSSSPLISSLMIPTAFTPNGDGANDAWIIDNLSEDASVRIYDRHGTVIFSSDNGYNRPWDGTFRGSSLPAGSYLYLIQNGPHTYRGSVTILL